MKMVADHLVGVCTLPFDGKRFSVQPGHGLALTEGFWVKGPIDRDFFAQRNCVFFIHAITSPAQPEIVGSFIVHNGEQVIP